VQALDPVDLADQIAVLRAQRRPELLRLLD
jgi:hypothetical protein